MRLTSLSYFTGILLKRKEKQIWGFGRDLHVVIVLASIVICCWKGVLPQHAVNIQNDDDDDDDDGVDFSDYWC